jgi:ribosomal protein L11 methyltransferase
MNTWGLRINASKERAPALAALLKARLGAEARVEGAGRKQIITFEQEAPPPQDLPDAIEGWLANLGEGRAGLWTRSLGAEGWEEGWRGVYHGAQVTPRLAVAPPWVDAGAFAGVVAVIDPRGGFGSGHHVTTRLILWLLDDLLAERGDLAGLRALDLGCGSGVLSVLMAKLGAAVVAVDRAPAARREAKAAAARNGVSRQVKVAQVELDALGERLGPFDLIMANLAPVAKLLPGLVGWCGGDLLASGLQLTHEERALRDAAPLTPQGRRAEGDWLALRWRRAR